MFELQAQEPSAVNQGSTWGQPGVNPGSTWGQPGVNPGSTGVNLHRHAVRGPGVHVEAVHRRRPGAAPPCSAAT